MATPQREADAPPQAANAAAVEGGRFSRALAQAQLQLPSHMTSMPIMRDLQRLFAMIDELESVNAQKEAEVQKVMEELESEKAQKEAQVQKVMKLESEKAQKEAQVQKLMAENVRLHSLLDKKEAQLQAMSEQCKFMALNHHN